MVSSLRRLSKIVFFILLSINTLVYAQEDNLSEYHLDRYNTWTGLNDRVLDIAIKPTELSYARNINYDNFPFITKREGYQKHTAYKIATDRIRGLFAFYRANGTKYLLAITNQKLYDITNGCWTELKSGLTSLDVEYDGTTFEDKFYITSTSDPLIEFDGTTATDAGGSPPRGAYIEAFANRLWIAGNCTYPSRVYASYVLDATQWDTATEKGSAGSALSACYFDVAPNDGDKITGLGVTLDSLIIFKENSIYVLYNAWGSPASDWTLKRVSSDTGCISNKSITNVKGELFFVSKKGVQTFRGATTEITYAFDYLKSYSLSDPIKGTFESLSQGQLDKSCGVNFDDKYWLAVPDSGSGYNNLILVFDYVVGAWTVYSHIYSNYFCVFKASSTDELYFGDSRDFAFIWKYGGVNYDGANVVGTAQGSQTASTLQDTSKNWQNDEFVGCEVHIYCGAGEGETRTIISNTSDTLTVSPDWSITPESGASIYCIGGIEMIADTGFLSMKGMGEFMKQWVYAYVQAKSFANETYYLKLFFDIDQTGWSPAYAVDLNNDYDDYGTDLWGEASYAGKDLITKRVDFPSQAIGKYIKVRFYNYRPDEEICIYNILFAYNLYPLEATEAE